MRQMIHFCIPKLIAFPYVLGDDSRKHNESAESSARSFPVASYSPDPYAILLCSIATLKDFHLLKLFDALLSGSASD